MRHTLLLPLTLALFAAVAITIAVAGETDTTSHPVKPNATLGPAEVVRIQVQALGDNGELERNGGIRLAFSFASPTNRAATGPIERFIDLVKNRGYRDLLDHREARYGELVVDGDRAAQRVTLTTLDYRQVEYVFFLSRYDTESCHGCWMTDAVQRADGAPAAGPRVAV